jgi:hypothetical protein
MQEAALPVEAVVVEHDLSVRGHRAGGRHEEGIDLRHLTVILLEEAVEAGNNGLQSATGIVRQAQPGGEE